MKNDEVRLNCSLATEGATNLSAQFNRIKPLTCKHNWTVPIASYGAKTDFPNDPYVVKVKRGITFWQHEPNSSILLVTENWVPHDIDKMLAYVFHTVKPVSDGLREAMNGWCWTGISLTDVNRHAELVCTHHTQALTKYSHANTHACRVVQACYIIRHILHTMCMFTQNPQVVNVLGHWLPFRLRVISTSKKIIFRFKLGTSHGSVHFDLHRTRIVPPQLNCTELRVKYICYRKCDDIKMFSWQEDCNILIHYLIRQQVSWMVGHSIRLRSSYQWWPQIPFKHG